MSFRLIVITYIIVLGLVVSNVLSLMWAIILQVGALAGLVFIGSLFVSAQRESRRSDTWDDAGP